MGRDDGARRPGAAGGGRRAAVGGRLGEPFRPGRRHGAGSASRRAARPSTAGSTRRSTPGSRRSPTSSSRNRRRARRPPRRPRRGSSSTTSTSTSRRAAGTAIPNAKWPTSCAATTATSSATRTSPSCIDTFHDRRNGYLFQTNPLGALRDMTVTDDLQNSAWNGIWYVQDRPLRAGLDGGGGDSVQDAALPRQRPADLGHQPAPAGEVEERVLVPVAGARRRSAPAA